MSKFKKVAIIARDADKIIDLKKDLSDFEYDETNPDFIVSLGGDGTYLVSERMFPGIPKLMIRDSKICNKCENKDPYHIISNILKEDYTIVDHLKLEANINGKKILCTNNFAIRNRLPTQAIRFHIRVNGEDVYNLMIGDGIIVATPFGSTAYYNSITRKSFDKGIGIAFNNTRSPRKELILDEDSEIEFELSRGDAVFVADNNPEVFELITGQVIKIKKATETAKLIKIKH